MLKSTHRPVAGLQQEPLPPSWTEHHAPSGHVYYYNSETKQSTYTRPVITAYTAPVDRSMSASPLHFPHQYTNNILGETSSTTQQFQHQGQHRQHQFHRRGGHIEDRPKSKQSIPDCAPWLLVKTKLKRRFVYNPDTKESFWKIPKDIIGGVIEYDIRERRRKEKSDTADGMDSTDGDGQDQGEQGEKLEEVLLANEEKDDVVEGNVVPAIVSEAAVSNELDDEYEEVEVTDDDEEGGDNDEHDKKRARLDDEARDADQEIMFGEEDMLRQLAEMGESHQLDEDEYGDDADAEDAALNEEEAKASFMDLLEDFRINPYTNWENIVSEGFIIEDNRYTLLPNMKRRKEVFLEWSTEKIQQNKLLKEKAAKQNPKIPYLVFLQAHASPKLFWPEFRRKFKKEPELKDTALSDKDREKLYRDHIHRISKLSEAERKKDLESLLKGLPASSEWNRSTSLESSLPPALLTDIRYISLRAEVRDPIIESYILKLPDAEDVDGSEEELAERARRREQAQAMQRREMQVDDARRRNEDELARGRGRLQAEERQLQQALNVGKSGLRNAISDS